MSPKTQGTLWSRLRRVDEAPSPKTQGTLWSRLRRVDEAQSFWSRVKGAFRPPEPPSPRRPQAPPARPPDAEAPPMPAEEAFLRQLLARVGPAPEQSPLAGSPVPPAPPSAIVLGGREFWSAIERLLATHRERTAIELLARFAAARPDDLDLAARLVELLCDRLEHETAIPHLERLLAAPQHALRARFLLAEAHERAGDLAAARRDYERVIAVDIDYPKARGRADRLRPRQESSHTAAAAETIAGVGGLGPEVSARYRLKRELGRGAAGAVYLARDLELERDVALKLLHPNASARARAEARVRSFNEARIAAALRHPGVVAIYDLDEERNLVAMELCAGGTLRDLLQRGRLAPAAALRRGVELCTTLEAVHRAGIVHRDIKPGNLLFRPLPSSLAALAEGDLVLGDFGLAHLVDAAPTEATGTLGYMAPEQRRGEATTASDLYAVGVILHEMLAGAAPFDRAALVRGETLLAALPDSVITSLGHVITRDVRELVDRLLSRDPAARPTAREVRERLAALRWLLDRSMASSQSP
ncbi:MAG: hypothetical protein EXR72_00785 [Myxococcales bacterium]|nr:hypothetical protein [Myxococcales bacterium]